MGIYRWAEGGEYRGQWEGDRMNGLGRLIKDGLDIKGEFFSDQFVRPIDNSELVDPLLRSHINGSDR